MRTTRAAKAIVTFLPPACIIADDDMISPTCGKIPSSTPYLEHPNTFVVLQTNDSKGLSQLTE